MCYNISEFLIKMKGKRDLMKKLIMIMAALLFSLTVSYAEEVNIPAMKNGQFVHARLHTTDSEYFYQYNNGRFSFHAYIPACMTSALLPTNGDGATFVNYDAAISFTASGGYNILNADVKRYYDWAVDRIGESSITYSDWGYGWYVVSGVKDGYVHYIKGLVGNDRHSSILVKYPYSQKEQYDWMIPVLESNFYQD